MKRSVRATCTTRPHPATKVRPVIARHVSRTHEKRGTKPVKTGWQRQAKNRKWDENVPPAHSWDWRAAAAVRSEDGQELWRHWRAALWNVDEEQKQVTSALHMSKK